MKENFGTANFVEGSKEWEGPTELAVDDVVDYQHHAAAPKHLLKSRNIVFQDIAIA